MKKLPIQSFSLLSLVLMAVSAMAAAIFPPNRGEAAIYRDQRGSFTYSTDNVPPLTCTPTLSIQVSCNVTAASGTTGIPPGSISNQTTAD